MRPLLLCLLAVTLTGCAGYNSPEAFNRRMAILNAYNGMEANSIARQNQYQYRGYRAPYSISNDPQYLEDQRRMENLIRYGHP